MRRAERACETRWGRDGVARGEGRDGPGGGKHLDREHASDGVGMAMDGMDLDIWRLSADIQLSHISRVGGGRRETIYLAFALGGAALNTRPVFGIECCLSSLLTYGVSIFDPSDVVPSHTASYHGAC